LGADGLTLSLVLKIVSTRRQTVKKKKEVLAKLVIPIRTTIDNLESYEKKET